MICVSRDGRPFRSTLLAFASDTTDEHDTATMNSQLTTRQHPELMEYFLAPDAHQQLNGSIQPEENLPARAPTLAIRVALWSPTDVHWLRIAFMFERFRQAVQGFSLFRKLQCRFVFSSIGTRTGSYFFQSNIPRSEDDLVPICSSSFIKVWSERRKFAGYRKLPVSFVWHFHFGYKAAR